jgi:hypothetical protein
MNCRRAFPGGSASIPQFHQASTKLVFQPRDIRMPQDCLMTHNDSTSGIEAAIFDTGNARRFACVPRVGREPVAFAHIICVAGALSERWNRADFGERLLH